MNLILEHFSMGDVSELSRYGYIK